MLEFEQVRYVNHLNEPLYFGENHMFVNLNTLHDFAWDVISQNDRITGFERTIHTKTFPVRIAAVSEAEGFQKRNDLFEIPEKDIRANTPGRLIINGCYLPCFLTSSEKTYYSVDGKFLSCELTITTDNAFWIREKMPEISGEYLINPNKFDSNFKIEIFGPASNPEIVIGGHVYQIFATVLSGDVLVIDSLNEEVYVTDEYETQLVSAFGSRNREYYIFEKIPAGRSEIVVDGFTNMRMTLYDERSEPIWSEYSDGGDDQYTQNWIYERIDQNVLEITYVYLRPSGITLTLHYIQDHLVEEREESSKIANYFKLENGRLIAYHD